MLASAVLAASGYALWAAQTGDAAGILTARRIIIPGIAMDSRPQPDSASAVVLRIEMVRYDYALTVGGQTMINLDASAHGPLPRPSDPPVTTSATLSIITHPSDVCAWNIEGATGNLQLAYSRLPGSSLRLRFYVPSDVSWYYMVKCPGPLDPIRFPKAPTNESFTGWLGLILGGPGETTIDVPVVSDPSNPFFGSCRGTLSNTSAFGTVTITVWVTDASCKLPTPTPGPTQSPYEPGIP